MIRKFNYTGRKKIKRSNIHVDIMRDGNGRRYFNTGIQLDDLELPTNARVYVEAYHRSGYQRFDFGTVGARKIPTNRNLRNISDAAVPLFRVKVVDKRASAGRILASVDKVRPENIDEIPAGSQSLLFVEYDDMGSKIWQLDLEGDWPVLKLNQHVEEISLVASSDSRFLSLVYPEVFRQILRRIVLEDQHTDPDCDDDWPSLWLKLACFLPNVNMPPQVSKPDQQAWIEKAVESFCANFNMLEKFNQSLQDMK
ncbi:MAG: hypothetical protein SWH54_10840 [Thermodesulfobacteriota bacterium]|nr:hypothetical protein [Thermodesulfobacteriota bacterium]